MRVLKIFTPFLFLAASAFAVGGSYEGTDNAIAQGAGTYVPYIGATGVINTGAYGITASSFTGNLVGAASLNVLKTRDTMTGLLTVPSLYDTGALTASTATVTGNAFSVGGSTLVVKNGQVGIGTTAPLAPLEISANVMDPSGTQNLTLKLSNPAMGNGIWFANNGSINSSDRNFYIGTGNTHGSFDIFGSSDNVSVDFPKTRAFSLTPVGGTGFKGEFTGSLSANSVNSTIGGNLATSSGFVGIGTTTPATKLDISSGTVTANGTGSGFTTSGNVTALSGTNIVYYCNGGVSLGNLCRGNGCTCAAGTWVDTGLRVP